MDGRKNQTVINKKRIYKIRFLLHNHNKILLSFSVVHSPISALFWEQKPKKMEQRKEINRSRELVATILYSRYRLRKRDVSKCQYILLLAIQQSNFNLLFNMNDFLRPSFSSILLQSTERHFLLSFVGTSKREKRGINIRDGVRAKLSAALLRFYLEYDANNI
jgi:hypothetical protein